MKYILISLLMFFSSTLYAQKQDFEGIIDFVTTIKANDSKVDVDIYYNAYGRSAKTYIKKGFYKQIMGYL